MSTPNQKIAAGLDEVERKRKDRPFRLQNLVGCPRTPSELHSSVLAASKARDRLREISANATAALTAFREEVAAKFNDAGKVKDENGAIADTIGNTARAKLIAQEVNKFKRTSRQETAEERAKLIRSVKEAAAGVDAMRENFASATTLLLLETIGDRRRGELAMSLISASPMTVESVMRQAIAASDPVLLSAALDRLDAMPKKSRDMVRINAKDASEALMGDKFRDVTETLGMARIVAVEADQAFLEVERGKTLPHLSTRIGIMRKNLADEINRPLKADREQEEADDDGNIPGESLSERLDRKYKSGPLPDGVVYLDDIGKKNKPDDVRAKFNALVEAGDFVAAGAIADAEGWTNE
jgi:hypothetical protein